MTMQGREYKELKKVADSVVEALASIAESQAEMLTLVRGEAQVQPEIGPPMCPHCNALDPSATLINMGGDGRLSEMVIAVETHCCNRTAFVLPDGIFTFPSVEVMNAAMTKEGGNGTT